MICPIDQQPCTGMGSIEPQDCLLTCMEQASKPYTGFHKNQAQEAKMDLLRKSLFGDSPSEHGGPWTHTVTPERGAPWHQIHESRPYRRFLAVIVTVTILTSALLYLIGAIE